MAKFRNDQVLVSREVFDRMRVWGINLREQAQLTQDLEWTEEDQQAMNEADNLNAKMIQTCVDNA